MVGLQGSEHFDLRCAVLAVLEGRDRDDWVFAVAAWAPHKFLLCETGGRLAGALEHGTPHGDGRSQLFLVCWGLRGAPATAPDITSCQWFVRTWDSEARQGSDKAAARRASAWSALNPVSAPGLRGLWNSRCPFLLRLRDDAAQTVSGQRPRLGSSLRSLFEDCRSTVAKSLPKTVALCMKLVTWVKVGYTPPFAPSRSIYHTPV